MWVVLSKSLLVCHAAHWHGYNGCISVKGDILIDVTKPVEGLNLLIPLATHAWNHKTIILYC